LAEIILLRFGEQLSQKIAAGLLNRGHSAIQIEELNELYDTLIKNKSDLVLINFDPDEGWPYLASQKIRKTKGISFTKILAITPKTNMGQIEKIFASGINDCFSRPFKLKALLDKIAELLIAKMEPEETVAEAKEDKPKLPKVLLDTYNLIEQEGRKLGDVAEISSGIAVHDPRARRMTCPGPDWSPAIIESSIIPFFINEEREFYLLRKDLMRRMPRDEEYKVNEKIIVKRTVLPVSAAIDNAKQPFVAGLYGVQTVKGLSCGYLCSVLNSRYCQFFFNRFRPPAEGLRGVYLAKKDLEGLPLIIPDMSEQMELVDINHRLSTVNPSTRNASRMIERGKMLAEANRLIFRIFGFTDEAIKELTDMHF